MNDLAGRLRQLAFAEGFDGFGICRPGDIPNAAARLAEHLEKNYHGQMTWMANRAQWRGNPSALWPEAKSVVMLAESYAPRGDPLETLSRPDAGTISVYARNRDYHGIVKKRLKRLGRWLIGEAPGAEIKVFVDTAPVMEKPLAEAAGLGWQGKHTNLVSRRLGSWFFLGAIFTTVALQRDLPEQDHCGSCRRCLDICPTDAFPSPYQLDSRRCISYLTIEHKGPVDESLRSKLGNRIFGCDDCLAVCPWNKFASFASEARYHARKELSAPKLMDLARLDDEEFRNLFRGGPVIRIGRNRLVRNVLYAIGNSGNSAYLPTALRLKSDQDPAVSDAADWAARRLEEDGRMPQLAAGRDAASAIGTNAGAGKKAAGIAGGARKSLLCIGFGYSARALAASLRQDESWSITGTARTAETAKRIEGMGVKPLVWPGDSLGAAIAESTHILVSVPPGDSGDRVVQAWARSLSDAAERIEWVGYLSTTAVYGDRAGGWVDEGDELRPGTRRGQLRVLAEGEWEGLALKHGLPVHVFRLAGIYGPGRGPLAQLAEGRKRRIVKKAGQYFNRIHVDDIARILSASMESPVPGAVYNVCDDLPASPAEVAKFCAALLGLPEPEEAAIEDADLSPMARSFYSESKRVSNRRMKRDLGLELLHPDYISGFRSLAG